MIHLLAVALVFMVAVMVAAWATVRGSGNGGWIDVFWTFGTGITGAAIALWPVEGAAHSDLRQLLVASLVAIWSLRLGLYITWRVARHEEDQRYVRLKEEWGATFYARLLPFMLLQAPVSVLLVASIRAAAARPLDAMQPTDALGLCILAMAIAGEALADQQMRKFKRDPANKGKVADTGLWSWSRHPNYFFEWLGWLAYPIIAIDLIHPYPAGWLSLLAPVTMYVVLTRLTGVPALEKHMLASRGEAYAAYQARTSAFFPASPEKRS
jgi:steroid 5-alpha reductase family enzyme